MGKVGRKTKYTPVTIAKILKHIKNGSNMVDSAQLSGINPDTLFTWIKLYPDFSDKVQEAIAKSKEGLIKNIVKAGKHNWQASGWLLERRYSKEYALKTIQELQGKDGNELVFKIVADIPRVEPIQGLEKEDVTQIEENTVIEDIKE